MATASYNLRKEERKDYKQLSDLQLPRLRAKQDNKLYDLDIVEEDVLTQRVKVHYIGYGSEVNGGIRTKINCSSEAVK